MDSWFLSAVRGSAGNERTVAEDPVRKFCLGRLRNLPAITLCVLLTATQAFLLNLHLVKSLDDGRQWIWFAGDALVVSSFIAVFYLREWRLKRLTARRKEETGFNKGLPFAAIGWLLYGALIAARVAIIFKLDLEKERDIGDLKMVVSMTAIICVFYTVGQHHNHESVARRAAIISLIKTFTIDLLDTVDILEVLFETAEGHEGFSVGLENYILFIVGLNLIRPAVVFISLFVDHFGSVKKSLMTKIIKTLLELLFLNMPLLGCRIYLAYGYDQRSVSVFLVKNILGIIFGIMEVYDCSFEYHEFCHGQGDFVDETKEIEALDSNDSEKSYNHNNDDDENQNTKGQGSDATTLNGNSKISH